ncbi:MAG: shikimate kinase, partial [Candidatus Eremiobacteraeota bacterium]|nr:shikimate kinase [Candidatus Eremiobacteraeota bacterium]
MSAARESEDQAGPAKHIALVGFMAAGKTTVGRALAEKLGLEFADSDALLVA